MVTAARPQTVSRWAVDPSHTVVEFAVRHLMVTTVKGRFTRFSGALFLDEADPTRSLIEGTVEAASVDTGDAQRDTHLRSADFFDVERFPQITFRSTRIEPLGDQRYRVIGNLTIRGVTREVALEAALLGRARDPWGNERLGFTAQATLDRRDFGLTWNHPLETGGFLVDNTVRITIEGQAVRQAE